MDFGSSSLSGRQAVSTEEAILAKRRDRIDKLLTGDAIEKTFRFSLALSGGGIRSATFSLGVLQALAEATPPPPVAATRQPSDTAPAAQKASTFTGSMLSRCEYLSTVSGGGYVGAFLCSLFRPERFDKAAKTIDAAADKAIEVLASGPPGRIRASSPGAPVKEPLAWLRENGRYLIPTGVGDAMYAAALGLRNWLAIHYVVATVLVPILCAAALLRITMASLRGVETWEVGALRLASATIQKGGGLLDSIWWSSLYLLWIVPVFLWVMPAGIAYWFSYRQTASGGDVMAGRSLGWAAQWQRRASWFTRLLNWAVILALLIALVLVLIAGIDDFAHPPSSVDVSAWILGGYGIRPLMWRVSVLVLVLAVLYYWSACATTSSVPKQRVLLTRWMSSGLITTGIVLVFALVETVGQSLYLWVIMKGSTAPVLTPAALVTVMVWATKRGAASFSKGAAPSWLTRLPAPTLGGIAGLVIFLLVACLWSLAITALTWNGEPPDFHAIASADQRTFVFILLALTIFMAWVTGRFPGFINLSSLQSFYSARLVRAYLGASNGSRFSASDRRRSLSAAEPLPDDELRLENYFSATKQAGGEGELSTHAPVHIINVTLNKTVDPAEQLVQRDRKGQPLAVMPFGYTVDGPDLNRFRTGPEFTEVQQPLSVGQWIGTSGAAFSTGIGRETSLGMSLLMGAANVRLGTWWESGIGSSPEDSGPWQWVTRSLREQFRTQAYLSYEFRARFFGMHRPWQYLSDGGHFENTALYELLRRDRKQSFIIASDNGADPDYGFADLANLIRLASIDLGSEVSVVRDFQAWPELAKVFGSTEDFAREPAKPDKDGAKAAPVATQPIALLLRVTDIGASTPRLWVVMLKPSVRDDASADIRQYAKTHPTFPQEPTTDQFFDEAQWESYRSLGHHNASLILTPAFIRCLRQFMAGNGRVASPPAAMSDRTTADH